MVIEVERDVSVEVSKLTPAENISMFRPASMEVLKPTETLSLSE